MAPTERARSKNRAARIFKATFGRFSNFSETVAPTKEVGTSGAYTSGGWLVSEEKSAALRGGQKWRTYGDLLANVAIVAAGTRAYLNLLSKSEWTLVPAEPDGEKDNAQAQEAADLVDDIINDLQRPWSRVVRRSGTYRFYGFSIQEWTAKRRDDGTIGMLDIAPRPAATIERWKLDKAGNVEGLTQVYPGTMEEVFLPRGKVIHIVDDALSDSPEGVGLFRHLVASNQRLARYQLLEAFGFETDLKGIPIGRAPYGLLSKRVADGHIDEAQKAAILKPLEDFIKQHIKNPELGLAMDSAPYRDLGEANTPSSVLEWDISLLQGSPTSAREVASAIERITRDMAIVLGVQGLLLGGDGSGSLALGRVFADQFALMVDSGLKELAEAYEHDLIPVILRLNGIPEELAPTFKTEQVQHRDIEQVTAALRDLADAGSVMAPDDPAINVIRGMLGLPPQDTEAMERDSSLDGNADDPLDPDDPLAVLDDPSE